jgi:hypothetical protein
MLFGTATPTLREQVKCYIELDGQINWKRHKQDATTILTNVGGTVPMIVDDNDTVTLSYTFDVSYYGNIEKVLRALGRILQDPDVVVTAELTEITRGECLIQSVLDAFRDVKDIIASRAPQ